MSPDIDINENEEALEDLLETVSYDEEPEQLIDPGPEPDD